MRKNKMMNIKDEHKSASVVVTGRNYCNILTMARALGEAGYVIKVLRVYKKKPGRFNLLGKMKPDAYSKYVEDFQECVVNDHPENIIESLKNMANPEEKMLLMPVDDYLACIVDENLDKLSMLYQVPNVAGKAGEIVRLMDKNEQKQCAEGTSLPMLQSVLIKAEGGVFEIPENISYPCFIKPNVSMNSTKAVMRKCEDKNTLQSVLKGYAEKDDFEILVEQYADIKNEYSVLGVSTGGNTIAPCMFRVLEGGNKERKGVSISGEIISCSEYETIIKVCIEYVDSLKYTGIFDIDLIETKDGNIYFIELNFRAGASTHAFTSVGVNLPGIFADYILKGADLSRNVATEVSGKRFVSEKVLLEEFARSDVNASGFRKRIKEADIHFIKDENDPRPYSHFKKYYLVAAVLRIPYRIRDFIRK